MPAPQWIEKLRQQWNVNSVWQVVIILIVFACTGFTIFFLKKPILTFLTGGQSTWLTSLLYYILILPVYNILLLGYGFVFGQFNFFWEFEKRFFSRITKRSRK